MAVISDAAIAAAARDAGIPADQIGIAVAISLAESGGDQLAHNTTPPDNSYGLWQINMYGNLGPSRRKAWGLNSNDDLFNVQTNARAMASISKGGKDWKPWTTYTRGSYLKYVNRGRDASSGVGSSGGTTQQVGLISGIGKLGDLISDPAVYRKAAQYTAGALLVVLGLILLLRLQKLIPAGKTLNAVRAVSATKGQ